MPKNSPQFERFLRGGSSLILRWLEVSAVLAAMSLFLTSRAGAQSPQDQAAQPAPQGDVQPAPAQAGSDSRPVISRDTIPQDPNHNGLPAPPRRAPSRRPASQAAPTGPVPANLTVPAGTVIFTRLNEPLSSDHNHAGDTFTATLDRPIVVDGWVVASRGETIVGSVTTAQKAGRVKGVSQLGLELNEVTIVDGQQLRVASELWKGSAGTSHGADAAGIATTTGLGTIIGAAANGGEGAGIGAGAGAVAGIALVLLTRGKPTVLGPETLLSFRLKEPIAISTSRSQQAFQPVGPYDYSGSPTLRQRGFGYAAYPPPYYTACGPYWGCEPYYGYGYWPAFGFSYYGGGYWHGYRHFR